MNDKRTIDHILNRLFVSRNIWVYEDQVKYLQGVFNRIRKEAARQSAACPACGTLPEEAEHDPTCPLTEIIET